MMTMLPHVPAGIAARSKNKCTPIAIVVAVVGRRSPPPPPPQLFQLSQIFVAGHDPFHLTRSLTHLRRRSAFSLRRTLVLWFLFSSSLSLSLSSSFSLSLSG